MTLNRPYPTVAVVTLVGAGPTQGQPDPGYERARARFPNAVLFDRRRRRLMCACGQPARVPRRKGPTPTTCSKCGGRHGRGGA
jgi:hypothetical protein